jgi:SAM-dependent methyltransferase
MNYKNDFYSSRHNLTLSSAREIVKSFRKIYKPRSVVDVGCGVGTFLNVWKKNGCVKVMGIDSENVPEKYLRLQRNEFLVMNLENSSEIEGKYDLAMSVEVAEHLTSRAGRILVKNLCALSDVVLFSAAIPRQGGVNHVNERWQSYWQKLFSRESYVCIDFLRPQIWNNKKIFYWYRQNILVYLRKNSKIFNEVSDKVNFYISSSIIDIVHPEAYILKSKEPKISLITNWINRLLN